MKHIFIFLLFITNILSSYELSICTIFQNEAPYLKEWIEFHVEHGVQHFYLYNNNSTDDYKIVLKPYVDNKLVDIFDWSETYKTGPEFFLIQCKVYLDCCQKIKHKDKWLAVIDSDEFLFSPIEKDLKKILKNYENYGAVQVNWVLYGTSNVNVPHGEKLINHLLYRSELSFIHNQIMKSIVRPISVTGCKSPHFFEFHPFIKAVNESKEVVTGKGSHPISVNKLRINHYWSRDLDYFYNEKIPRRVNFGYPYEEAIDLESQMNDIYDPILKTKSIE